MKAVVLAETGAPGNLNIDELDTPEPGPGQVRVCLFASALNRRDYWITKGMYPGLKLPAILGSDGAGVVESVGTGVDAAEIGRQVIIYPANDWGDEPRFSKESYRILGMPDPGTMAEYICVPVENIFPKPPHLDWRQTAAISLAGLTAWRVVSTKAALSPGDKVLITGIGGGVATLCLLFAIGHGAEVYVTSGSDEKIEKARAMGAEGGVNYREDDWYDKLQAVSGGVDVVIDGNCGSIFHSNFKALNPGGRYIIYGATLGIPPEGVDVFRLFFRQVRIEGTTMGTPIEFKEMLDFVSANRIKPVISKIFDLEDVVAAFEYLGSGKQMGKIVLDHGQDVA